MPIRYTAGVPFRLIPAFVLSRQGEHRRFFIAYNSQKNIKQQYKFYPMAKELSGYDLSRSWFNFCFENPDKIRPNHTALYFFAIEHCNRLGWKEKFGLPTTMAMEAIGIRSYNTYINTLKNLVEFGFIKMIETSKNQYSSNIIALSNFNKALDKALDKALIKHTTKQRESNIQSTGESIDSINKQRTKNKEQLNNKQSFNNYPLSSDFNGIPKNTQDAAAELIFISQKVKVTDEDIVALWGVFKEQNLTGENWFANAGKVYGYFINWAKTQNFQNLKNNNATHQQSFNGKYKGKSAGANILLDMLKNDINPG